MCLVGKYVFIDQANQESGLDNPVYASTVEKNVNVEEGDVSNMLDSEA